MSEQIDFEKRLETEKKVRHQIESWLDEHGFRRGLHGFCKHKKGLPLIPNVMVRPSHSPEPGSRTLMVTPNEIIDAVVPEPYGNNDWRIRARTSYQGLGDLKAKLDGLAYVNVSSWET